MLPVEAAKGMLPGSYIIRIYRRGEDDPRMVVGLVEEVGVREKKGFHSIEELRLILDLPLGQPILQKPEEGVQREALSFPQFSAPGELSAGSP